MIVRAHCIKEVLFLLVDVSKFGVKTLCAHVTGGIVHHGVPTMRVCTKGPSVVQNLLNILWRVLRTGGSADDIALRETVEQKC